MNTIEEAKQYLRDNWEKGVECPCCKQFVKLYHRKLNSAMAYGLVLLYQKYHKDGEEWVHTENYLKTLSVPASIRGDISKLRYWGLLSRQIGTREDGSNRVGFYKITDKGRAFVRGEISVPDKISLYNQEFFGFSDININIRKALGNKFDYGELMGHIAQEDAYDPRVRLV